jgi:hypothetical protein
MTLLGGSKLVFGSRRKGRKNICDTKRELLTSSSGFCYEFGWYYHMVAFRKYEGGTNAKENELARKKVNDALSDW